MRIPQRAVLSVARRAKRVYRGGGCRLAPWSVLVSLQVLVHSLSLFAPTQLARVACVESSRVCGSSALFLQARRRPPAASRLSARGL